MSEVVVLQSFVGNLGGGDLHFHAGELYASDHKAAKKWPHLFGPFQPAVIESATAAPGEKRGIRLRRGQGTQGDCCPGSRDGEPAQG